MNNAILEKLIKESEAEIDAMDEDKLYFSLYQKGVRKGIELVIDKIKEADSKEGTQGDN